ncbi:MAG: hypothetical protein H6887_03885 [Hoeflea sp.]|nr:hypothetical protein [Hoeflea sp.]
MATLGFFDKFCPQDKCRKLRKHWLPDVSFRQCQLSRKAKKRLNDRNEGAKQQCLLRRIGLPVSRADNGPASNGATHPTLAGHSSRRLQPRRSFRIVTIRAKRSKSTSAMTGPLTELTLFENSKPVPL